MRGRGHRAGADDGGQRVVRREHLVGGAGPEAGSEGGEVRI